MFKKCAAEIHAFKYYGLVSTCVKNCSCPFFEKHDFCKGKLSWEEFALQADVTGDGKVSIEEAVVWVEKQFTQ